MALDATSGDLKVMIHGPGVCLPGLTASGKDASPGETVGTAPGGVFGAERGAGPPACGAPTPLSLGPTAPFELGN